jgi:hypothetical protein
VLIRALPSRTTCAYISTTHFNAVVRDVNVREVEQFVLRHGIEQLRNRVLGGTHVLQVQHAQALVGFENIGQHGNAISAEFLAINHERIEPEIVRE